MTTNNETTTTEATNGKTDNRKQLAGLVSPETFKTVRLNALIDDVNQGDLVGSILDEWAADHQVNITKKS